MSLDLKRQLIAQLVETSRLLRNFIDHRAKTRGTTRAQWIVLFRLRQQEGLSQVDLADVLELQPISLVRLLDRLVEHGLLERRHDPKDRRANRLFLTASGRQLVDDLDSLRDAIATDVIHDMPAETVQTTPRRVARHQGPHQVAVRPQRSHRGQVAVSAPSTVVRPFANVSKSVSKSGHAAIHCRRMLARSYQRRSMAGSMMDELNGKMIACQILVTGLIARVASEQRDPLRFLTDFRDEIRAVVKGVNIAGMENTERVRFVAQQTVDELFSLMKPPSAD